MRKIDVSHSTSRKLTLMARARGLSVNALAELILLKELTDKPLQESVGVPNNSRPSESKAANPLAGEVATNYIRFTV